MGEGKLGHQDPLGQGPSCVLAYSTEGSAQGHWDWSKEDEWQQRFCGELCHWTRGKAEVLSNYFITVCRNDITFIIYQRKALKANASRFLGKGYRQVCAYNFSDLKAEAS